VIGKQVIFHTKYVEIRSS